MPIIPILVALAPLLPKMIQLAEDVFRDKEKSGIDKAAFVVNQAGGVVDALARAGQGSPQDIAAAIPLIVEAVVQIMKDQGLLVEHGKQQALPAPVPMSGRVITIRGTIVED